MNFRLKKNLDSTILFLMAGGLIFFLGLCALKGLDYPWNGVRLLPALGIFRGYSLYYLPTAGPLIPRAYPPLGLLAYLPIGFFRSPNAAVLAGQIWSMLMILGAATFFLVKLEQGKVRFETFMALIFFALLSATLSSSLAIVTWIHVDAATVALMFVGFALLLNSSTHGKTIRYVAAGIFLGLACYSKQSAAFPALGALVALGLRQPKRVRPALMGFAGTGIVVGALFVAYYGWAVIEYQWFGHLSKFPMIHSLSKALGIALSQWFWPLAVIALCLRKKTKSWRDIPLPIFVLGAAALAASVIAIPAYRKIEGDINSIGCVTLLWTLIAALAFRDWLVNRSARRANPRWRTRVLVGCMAWEALLIGLNWASFQSSAFYFNNETQKIYDFALEHPNEVYAPYHPLATFMADHRLYHFGVEVYDQIFIGQPFTREHFHEFLPRNFRYFVVPPNMGVYAIQTGILMGMLPNFTVELESVPSPGWITLTNQK